VGGFFNFVIMRFTEQKELSHNYRKRIKKQETKFLWFPLTANYETRWLERATIEYEVYCTSPLLSHSREYYWKPVKFLNK